ncbi:rCG20678 [Rattus norvegicus]|uniref:RCG20678 n=1 Tax=Rattus norvegicus TaxID=10116 RepID=A6JER7_RAT|nr:rCG20678 [Rattus norvegicus]
MSSETFILRKIFTETQVVSTAQSKPYLEDEVPLHWEIAYNVQD